MTAAERPGLLDGLVVLITGAASGIGQAAAELAAREGARGLVISDRNAPALDAVAEELRAAGTDVESRAGEITDAEINQDLVARAVARFGRLDAAVNNAGIRGPEVHLADLPDAEFDRVLDVNLRAVFRGMRAQLTQMYAQGSGAIVNVASAGVFGVGPTLGPYVASKLGVIGLSKVAAKEAGRRGVRVNVVAPGRTDTPLLGSFAAASGGAAGEHDAAALVAPIPLGRMGRPDELGDAIIYLCSDRSSFVNGAVLTVDGGRTG